MPDLVTINQAKLKQFFWDVKDRRSVERGIGGYYNNDTTQVNTISNTRVNLKTYTFTASSKSNMVRVRVYGHAGTSTTNLTAYLNINGKDVASYSANPGTSPILIIDYIGNIIANASNTIKVDGYTTTSSAVIYIDQVVIIAGFGLTSTTSVNILTVTLDSANDVYTLNVSGNFVYKVGIRWWVKGNRKTTANATFTSNLTNEIQGYYKPSASDDGDNNVFIIVRTGDYATSFTISGNVGALGDTIIIVGIYCQIVLRGYYNYREITVKEKGVMNVTSRHVTIDGTSQPVNYIAVTSNATLNPYRSASSSDVTVTSLVFTSNDSPEVVWRVDYGEDYNGRSLFLYVNIIVLGV